jgi:hypothetical protein
MTQAPEFMKGEPDIGQSETGNRTADKVIEGDGRNPPVHRDEMIIGPDGEPRQDEEEHSQLEAEKDVEDEEGSVHLKVQSVSLAFSGPSLNGPRRRGS